MCEARQERAQASRTLFPDHLQVTAPSLGASHSLPQPPRASHRGWLLLGSHPCGSSEGTRRLLTAKNDTRQAPSLLAALLLQERPLRISYRSGKHPLHRCLSSSHPHSHPHHCPYCPRFTLRTAPRPRQASGLHGKTSLPRGQPVSAHEGCSGALGGGACTADPTKCKPRGSTMQPQGGKLPPLTVQALCF